MNLVPDFPETRRLSEAIQDFRRARSQATLKELVRRLTGQPTELLSYTEVRQKLRAYASTDRGLEDIPLDAIVGSVGRYNDFTRDFLPRLDSTADRWAHVKAAADGLLGLPPIDVYKIGEAYFVEDGNHRVSVARQLGAKSIQAYVTEVRTRVPLSPNVQPDDLIVKAEYAEFLERTRLDELRPGIDLSVTIPGQYPILLEHIGVHRHYMGNEQKRYIPFAEAATHWYDTVYLPSVQAIREVGILRNFPNRTETDLYLWIAEYRASLENELGLEIKTEVAALDLLKQEGQESDTIFNRIGRKILNGILPELLESGPPPGQWREEAHLIHRDDCLFTDILVPVSGKDSGWYALDQAIVIARKEGSRLIGLHIVPAEEEKETKRARAIASEFTRRCQEGGVDGRLIINPGEVTKQIFTHARLTDLVVTTLLYPPPPELLARLDSGFRELIQRCPRPVMAVPEVVTGLQHALLSYDGSPKSEEALFVATYLAGRWGIHLTVVTVFDKDRVAPETLLRAQVYLEERGVKADLVPESGLVADTILRVANARQVDLIIMGGYGFKPVLEVILGSTVDQVLREARKPVLICR
jgi:nucleotide-binding universal stress UspA family protein